MQRTTIKFTKNDLAKYPFLKEAAEYVKTLDLKIEDLAKAEYTEILNRAEERVNEAILKVTVTRKLGNEEIEILSFPTAIILAAATENPFIKKRYALAEAKQAYNDLKLEPIEKILAVAKNFNWKIAPVDMEEVNAPYIFKLHFTDYLKNTANLRERRWKLVNKPLASGNVYLTKNETVRLLSEEVRRYIEKRLEIDEPLKLPQKITEKAEKLRSLTLERMGKAEIEGIPKTIKMEAFPPCIKALYEAAYKGHHLSHIGRFTLTSFLINIGMPMENIIELFKGTSDFKERLTRYQVEHIAGERGSRTRYNPPRCETLKTHGVCLNQNELCKTINHPLKFYKRSLKIKTSTAHA
ncbi:MAG: DNA primase large subunit PriL [Nitrososphaerota archaeon]|nr:DNA primase large subunit PriL [Candidatus Bathyarchaeota archaeon]MDW8023309.1 DNA primase large subunit PriL [Nitrososphaerota archaeon]